MKWLEVALLVVKLKSAGLWGRFKLSLEGLAVRELPLDLLVGFVGVLNS